MREYKLRVWDKETLSMVYLLDLNNQEIGFCEKGWVFDGGFREGYVNKWIDKFELMQYTGLKDKNNKDIYEGDIVMVQIPLGGFWGDTPNKKISVVMFSEESARFIAKWEWSKNQHHIDLDCDLDIEVIGNQYENPSLLNTKQ